MPIFEAAYAYFKGKFVSGYNINGLPAPAMNNGHIRPKLTFQDLANANVTACIIQPAGTNETATWSVNIYFDLPN